MCKSRTSTGAMVAVLLVYLVSMVHVCKYIFSGGLGGQRRRKAKRSHGVEADRVFW